jgi:hypothetical protein
MLIPLFVGLARLIHFQQTNFLLPDEALYYVVVDRFFYANTLSLAYSTRDIFQYMIFAFALIFRLNTLQSCISFMIMFTSLISSLTVYIIYKILKLINQSSYALLLLVVSPAFLLMGCCVLTETYGFFFFVLGTYIFLLKENYKNVFTSGFMYSVAFNFREPYAFAIAIVGLYLLYKRNFRMFIIFCIGVYPFFYMPSYVPPQLVSIRNVIAQEIPKIPGIIGQELSNIYEFISTHLPNIPTFKIVPSPTKQLHDALKFFPSFDKPFENVNKNLGTSIATTIASNSSLINDITEFVKSPANSAVENGVEKIVVTSNPKVEIKPPEGVIAYPPSEYYEQPVAEKNITVISVNGVLSILNPYELKSLYQISSMPTVPFSWVVSSSLRMVTFFRMFFIGFFLSMGVGSAFVLYGIFKRVREKKLKEKIFLLGFIPLFLLFATSAFVAQSPLYTTEERLLFESLSTFFRLGHISLLAIPILSVTKKKYILLAMIVLVVVSPAYLFIVQSNLSSVFINRLSLTYRSSWLMVDEYLSTKSGKIILAGEPIERVMLYRRQNVTYMLPTVNFTEFQLILKNQTWSHIYLYGEKHTIHYMVIAHNFPWFYDLVKNKTDITIIWDNDDSYLYEFRASIKTRGRII